MVDFTAPYRSIGQSDPYQQGANTLKMMIPLVYRKRELDMKKQVYDQQLQQEQEQLELERADAQKKIEMDAAKTEVDRYYEALKSRNQVVADFQAQKLQGMGQQFPLTPEGRAPLDPMKEAPEQQLSYDKLKAQALLTGDKNLLNQITAFERSTQRPRDNQLSFDELKAKAIMENDPNMLKRLSEFQRESQQPMIDKRRFADERTMRKDFMAVPEVKEFPEIKHKFGSAGKAIEVARSGKGSMNAVDQSLITVLNKMLDPTSVVRESEYARTPEGMAVVDRLEGYYTRLKQGGAGLSMAERESIYEMSKNLYDVAESMYDEQVSYYTDLATDYGYSPERIVRLGGAKGGSEYQQKPAGSASAPATEDPLGIR